ncbi:copper radical oxidase (WSC domain-containing protein) [Colletotrichum truncatum]|uniref:Copper radical oxidase (WSC domain-containing protein) n=1 Tax=Colletotrichum truncatum TaxID=5467 RepID=A0ACC3YPB2_COLTU
MRGLDCPAAGTGPNTMTVEGCLDACEAQGYSLAGLEWSQECFCGNTMIGQNRPIADTNCNNPCKGNPSQLCGGSAAMNLYVRDNYAFTMGPAAVLQSANGWNTPVCMKDPDANFRLLPGKPNPEVDPKSMTVQKCVAACGAAGYSFAGLEYGRECYCSNTAPSTSAIAPNSDCDNPCLGDASSICGGRNRILVYTKSQTVTMRGIIQAINRDNSQVIGYMSKTPFEGGQTRYDVNEANALIVTFQVPTGSTLPSKQLQIAMGDNTSPQPNTILGLLQGRDDANSVLSAGSFHYTYIGGTNPTPKGSPPVTVGNAYTTGTGQSRTSESDVWVYDPTTNEITATWINPDGTFYTGGDRAAFLRRYPAAIMPLTFKFIAKP